MQKRVNTKAKGSAPKFQVLPLWVIHLFLWLGLLAGVAVRSLMLLNHYNPGLVIWFWRFAMLSYTIFFGYRYIIGRRRRRVIFSHNLISTLEQSDALDPATQRAMLYILRSITRSKELFNYAFICILSIVALLLDLLLN